MTQEQRNEDTVNALLASGIPENVLKLVALQVRVEVLVAWLAPPQAELFEETFEKALAVALTALQRNGS